MGNFRVPFLPLENPELEENFQVVQAAINELQALGPSTAASAYRNAAQTLGVGTITIELDTVSFDPHSLFDLANHRYVVPSTGIYHVDAQVTTLLQNNPQVNMPIVLRSGEQVVRGARTMVRGGTVNDLWAMTASGLVKASAGDHLELACINGGANGQALEIQPALNNFLSVFRVA